MMTSDDERRRFMLDMRSSAYLNDQRSSIAGKYSIVSGNEEVTSSISQGAGRSGLQVVGDGKDVSHLIESIQEEREAELDDQKDHQLRRNINLKSIQRHDSREVVLKPTRRAFDQLPHPRVPSKAQHSGTKLDRILNADIEKQLKMSDGFKGRTVTSPPFASAFKSGQG